MHQCAGSTVEKVNDLYRVYGSWRKLASVLGYGQGFAPTLCNVGLGKLGAVSKEVERDLRKRCGIIPHKLIFNMPIKLLARLIRARIEI